MSSLVDRVVEIVELAGQEILRIYRTDFDVTTKGDASPLTLADLNAHRTIVTALAALTPDVPIVSEESTPPPFDVRRRWSRYWLVDPLDGTREFVSKNGEFTVNVALIVDHRPVLGVVGVPAHSLIYVGDKQEGRAEKRTNSGAVGLRAREMERSRPLGPPALGIVASRSHGGERLETFIGSLQKSFNVDRSLLGSSLKFCILAEGKADLYPRLGPTSEWDIAAAQAVLEAAGGRVSTFDGQPLLYNTKESFLNPEFYAVGDPNFPWHEVLPRV